MQVFYNAAMAHYTWGATYCKCAHAPMRSSISSCVLSYGVQHSTSNALRAASLQLAQKHYVPEAKAPQHKR